MKRRLLTALLAALLALTVPTLSAAGAAEAEPGYVIGASVSGNVCTLTISLRDALAYNGRIALCFDTERLTLRGSGFQALSMQNGTQYASDQVAETELVDGARGYVGFAWYGTVDARTSDKAIARVSFTMKAAALDSGSFTLRYVPEEGFGSWYGPASMAVERSGQLDWLAYLNTTRPALAVTFAYPGSEDPPADGAAVTIQCRDLLGEPVAATVELNGRAYETDGAGSAALCLRPGQYWTRVRAAGYGDQYQLLTVTAGGPNTLALDFVSDALLVEQARRELELGFAEGDSAEAVTQSLGLTTRTDSGVDVAWTSSDGGVITREGLVFRPSSERGGVVVTLTAVLTRGEASAEKTFTVTVPAREEESPETSSPETGTADRFTDLAGYDWARTAVNAMAEAGVIAGVGGGRFSPGANIKRGDFILLLARMMRPETAETAPDFDDVEPGEYWYDAIMTARALGIALGDGNRFRPSDPITRQDMIVLTTRALNATGYVALSGEKADLSGFSDAGQVAAYARDHLAAAVADGLIVGDAGRLNPLGSTTRAEAAVFLYRLLQKAG